MIIYINLVNDEKMRLTIPTHINYNTVAHENEKREEILNLVNRDINHSRYGRWKLC